MAKTKKKKSLRLWIIIPLVAVVLFAIFNLSKNNFSQFQQPATAYLVYQDPTYGFSIEYPQAWEARKNTQVFENGDTVAFGISGPTQKENTELTDGAQVAISKPFSISKDLETWVREYYARYSEFSKKTLSGRTYQKVYSCGHDCMTYYYTQINDQIYGVAVFAEGPDQDKMVYENASIYMLKSFKFTNVRNEIVSKEQAIAKIKALPEVKDYLKSVLNGQILVNSEDSRTYFIQVYELKDGHTATFNWYNVFKTTGAIEKQF